VIGGRLRFGLALVLLLVRPAGPHASVGVPAIRTFYLRHVDVVDGRH